VAKKLSIPRPIIFGRKTPNLRQRVYDGKTYIYSISNYNLYIYDHNLDETGTYTIGALYSWSGGAPFLERPLVVPLCTGPCPMLLKDWFEGELDGDDGEKVRMVRAELQDTLEVTACPRLAALLDCTTTEAERRFAEMYYKWAVSGATGRKGAQRFSDFVRDFERRQLGLQEWQRSAWVISNAIKQSLKVPALIPQAWLNWAYDSSKSPEETSAELGYMPQRADFVFIYGGRLHVVEIDDPSHYARYDERAHRYEVDEERYTRNLRAERSLREQGLEIHRLSNWEVLNSTDRDLVRLIRVALGISPLADYAQPSMPNPDDLPF